MKKQDVSRMPQSSAKDSPAVKSPSHVESDSDDEDAGALSRSQILALKEQFDASDIDGGGSLDIDEVISFYCVEDN